ncbi:MAG: NAD(P)-dependent glycerol-3-phosphate dehydrogenase [Planctomycetes bacterium]|nr:NAD(P)-dependent glycerol-3-phosphate dehydrogenase [Planctomycetota bacterium]
MRNICILGTGGWGTALAIHLRDRGCAVKLWGRSSDYVRAMMETRENAKYLPGIKLPPEVHLVTDAAEALDGVQLVVEAVPTQFIRPTLKHVRPVYPEGVPVLSGSKGIENRTLFRGSQVIRDVLGNVPVGAISGPSHCEEVVRGRPTSVVIASEDRTLTRQAQKLFNGGNFRVYTNSDLIGVELCGAVKNVIAIAAGICDGLGYGDNTKAAVLTRGLAEIARLGKALGARPQTFAGLAGVGDLYTTCASPYGRNRAVGERLGRGESLEEIRSSMEQVAEGVDTTRSVRGLAARCRVEMAICQEVYRVLFQHKSPARAVRDLMRREPKDEHEGS